MSSALDAMLTLHQAMIFTSDMKLGHYMKIPPRTVFWGQVSAQSAMRLVRLRKK